MSRVVSLMVGLMLFTVGAPAHGQTIPAVRATSLAGDVVSLPADLRGRTAVLVMGFSHDSQTAVRSWGKRLEKEFGDSSGATYYEMAMLGGAPRLVRGFIVRSMKKQIPEDAQAHFLPVMDDDAPWRTVAHYGKADAAYVIVVDGTGHVLWETSGDATDAAYAEMKQKVR